MVIIMKKMEKKSLLILALLFVLNIRSQENCYVVEYDMKINVDESLLNKNEAVKSLYQSAFVGAESMKFILKGNSLFSVFEITNIGIHNEEYEIAKILSKYIGKCTYDIKNKVNYLEIEDDSYFRKNEFIIKDTIVDDWVKSTETKKISGYECFKATKSLNKNKHLTVSNIELIAWFCPKISLSTGPNGYSGLPGLILELNINEVSYLASKISFCKNKMDINLPRNGKYITFFEFNKIFDSRKINFRR